jgi:hypothetical protein
MFCQTIRQDSALPSRSRLEPDLSLLLKARNVYFRCFNSLLASFDGNLSMYVSSTPNEECLAGPHFDLNIRTWSVRVGFAQCKPFSFSPEYKVDSFPFQVVNFEYKLSNSPIPFVNVVSISPD